MERVDQQGGGAMASADYAAANVRGSVSSILQPGTSGGYPAAALDSNLAWAELDMSTKVVAELIDGTSLV